MNFRLLVIGKTSEQYLREGIEIYLKRLSHYCEFSMEVIADVKNSVSLPTEKLKSMEADAFLKKIKTDDTVILLDDKGKLLTSLKFAAEIEKWSMRGNENIVFIIGGAFGFGENLEAKAKMKISLSAMTFSHQMVRLIFAEQLYRAFTILKREAYHHE